MIFVPNQPENKDIRIAKSYYREAKNYEKNNRHDTAIQLLSNANE